jgi:Sec-independent protein translocase protein TatA
MNNTKTMIRITAATMKRIGTLLLLAVGLLSTSTTHGFTNPVGVQRHAAARPLMPTTCNPQLVSRPSRSSTGSSTSLNVLGGDGGILGVGAPEIATILVVGYFVLGPSELYKLVKEIGKFVQNFRSLSTEASKQFESTMENQLELTELRKAQTELNNAFSFRRSINTDEAVDAFTENELFTEKAAAAAAATASGAAAAAEGEAEGATAVKKKKRLVRRKKKKVVAEEEPAPVEEELSNLDREIAMEYPDLDMLDESPSADVQSKINEEDKLRAERMERLSGGSTTAQEPDWFTASEEEIASEVLNTTPKDPALEAYEKNRFQSQLTAEDWNAQIMANEDKLSPLAMVMQRLAILEEEKNAADRRLEEEYERRMDNEDKFYLEKRRVLEEAIEDIQRDAFSDMNGGVGGAEKKEEEGSVEGEKKKQDVESETVVNSGPKFSA